MLIKIKNNKLISLTSERETIRNDFLQYNKNLKELILLNVETIGDNFLRYNENLKELNLLNVETIGDNFLRYNETLEELNLPNVKTIGYFCLSYNKKINVLKNIRNISSSIIKDINKFKRFNV